MIMPKVMRAMRLHSARSELQLEEVPVPEPRPGQVLVKVSACGVCRTDLHILEGDLQAKRLPLIPGHEIVGRVVGFGDSAPSLKQGTRIGIPWLGSTCGSCFYSTHKSENLCDGAEFTGYTLDGGYAQYCVADARYCFELPPALDDITAAPLLCAGLIGFRALRMTGEADRLGIMGFGAAAHILTQIAVWQGREVYAFTRPQDGATQDFARSLGASWAGGSGEPPPSELDAVIIFAPVGSLVPTALKTLRKGGRVVCAGIHMSDIPGFPYEILWGEREIVSVANLTRADGLGFLDTATKASVRVHTHEYDLASANAALDDLRTGRVRGAAVLSVS